MHPRNLSTLLLTVPVLPAQAVVLPPAAAVSAPTITVIDQTTFFGSSGIARTQALHDVAAISVPAASWSTLSVRRPGIAAGANAACTVQLKLSLSLSPQPYWSASTTFAANHGPLLTTVFNGPLMLPARAAAPAWPAQWEPIPFAMQFLYVAALGRSLVVDFEQTANSATTGWQLEASGVYSTPAAANAPNPSACKRSNGKTISGWSGTAPEPGADWSSSFYGLAPGLIGIGAVGVGGAGTSWGGLVLPVDLGPFGAPGCSWGVTAELTVPLQADAVGRATWPPLRVPADPALGGTSFYEQAAFFDTGANALGLVTTSSHQWFIGKWAGPGATVSRSGTVGASGTLATNQLTTLRLQ